MKIKKLEFEKCVSGRSSYNCSNDFEFFLLEPTYGIGEYGIKYYPWQTKEEVDMDFGQWIDNTEKYSLEKGIEYLKSEYEKRVIESIEHPEKCYWEERFDDDRFIYLSFLVTPLGDFASISKVATEEKFTVVPNWASHLMESAGTLGEAEQLGIDLFNRMLQKVIDK